MSKSLQAKLQFGSYSGLRDLKKKIDICYVHSPGAFFSWGVSKASVLDRIGVKRLSTINL